MRVISTITARRSGQTLRAQAGASMFEYALIVAFISMVSLAANRQLGLEVKRPFTRADDALRTSAGNGCDPASDCNGGGAFGP